VHTSAYARACARAHAYAYAVKNEKVCEKIVCENGKKIVCEKIVCECDGHTHTHTDTQTHRHTDTQTDGLKGHRELRV
jgi:hypothetical protein